MFIHGIHALKEKKINKISKYIQKGLLLKLEKFCNEMSDKNFIKNGTSS